MFVCVSQSRGDKSRLVMSFVHIIHRPYYGHLEKMVWCSSCMIQDVDQMASHSTFDDKWPNFRVFLQIFFLFCCPFSPLLFVFHIRKTRSFFSAFQSRGEFQKVNSIYWTTATTAHILLFVVHHGKRKFEVLDNLHEPSVKKDVIKLNLNKLCIISELLRETTKNNFDKAL